MTRRRDRGLRVGVATALVAGVAALGCGGGLFSRQYPERRQFVLEATRLERAAAPAGAPVLAVMRFRTSAVVTGTSFVYRTGPQTYERDFYDVFWTSPEGMLSDAVRRWLAASGLFADVLDASSSAARAYQLDGADSEHHGDYRDAAQPRAALGLRFALLDVRGAEPKIVFHAEYAASPAIADESSEALAAGWNAALREILGKLEADLRAVVSP